ncbi:MAG: VWA domain-containing protein [Chloroflexota bacterium]|nr:VWA domain-containing protein [Chloroflexota bacterium]
MVELASILQGADMLVGNMGSDIRVVWSSGETSYTDLQRRVVALDYGPLRRQECPFPGSVVDEVIGYAAHEGGHCLWTAPGKDGVIEQGIHDLWPHLPAALQHDWQANQQATLAELCRIQNVLEDAYVDQRVAIQWPVLGEYIRIARERLRQRTSIDLAAIARSDCPDRNSAINLWVSLSLYGHPMPAEASERVRRAAGALLALSQRAAAEEEATIRQTMTLAAATILWHEFPTGGVTPPGVSRASVTEVSNQDGPASDGIGHAPQQMDTDQVDTAMNLDDFDPATAQRQGGRQVDQVPPALLSEVHKTLSRDVEDLSEPVAQALAEQPWQVGALARRADYDPIQARAVSLRVQRETRQIRQAFQRQRSLDTLWRHGLDRGRLDERRLWKPLLGDPTFHKRKDARSRSSLAIGLLLDVSGSMKAYMPIVEETAAAFSQGLLDAPGIDFAAWCYTGKAGQVALTRICDRQMPRLCLSNIEKHESTPSGAAIAAVKVLMGRMRGRNKLLIHFTDGRPDNPTHVVRAVAACVAAGVQVHAIGLPKYREMLSAQYGEGNYEVVEAVSGLPGAVATIVRALGQTTSAVDYRRRDLLATQLSRWMVPDDER